MKRLPALSVSALPTIIVGGMWGGGNSRFWGIFGPKLVINHHKTKMKSFMKCNICFELLSSREVQKCIVYPLLNCFEKKSLPPNYQDPLHLPSGEWLNVVLTVFQDRINKTSRLNALTIDGIRSGDEQMKHFIFILDINY